MSTFRALCPEHPEAAIDILGFQPRVGAVSSTRWRCAVCRRSLDGQNHTPEIHQSDAYREVREWVTEGWQPEPESRAGMLQAGIGWGIIAGALAIVAFAAWWWV